VSPRRETGEEIRHFAGPSFRTGHVKTTGEHNSATRRKDRCELELNCQLDASWDSHEHKHETPAY
jgi:hypothetical protein